MAQLNSTPPRTIPARLDPFGDINVHLETQPDPPKTGGIPLIVRVTDQGDKSVAVDRVEYEYWSERQSPQTLTGQALGAGAFTAVAALSSVGEWQIRVTLFKGTQRMQVDFIVRVMPNI